MSTESSHWFSVADVHLSIYRQFKHHNFLLRNINIFGTEIAKLPFIMLMWIERVDAERYVRGDTFTYATLERQLYLCTISWAVRSEWDLLAIQYHQINIHICAYCICTVWFGIPYSCPHPTADTRTFSTYLVIILAKLNNSFKRLSTYPSKRRKTHKTQPGNLQSFPMIFFFCHRKKEKFDFMAMRFLERKSYSFYCDKSTDV